MDEKMVALNPEDFDLDEIDANMGKRVSAGIPLADKNQAILDVVQGRKTTTQAAKDTVNPHSGKPVQPSTVLRWAKDFRDEVAVAHGKPKIYDGDDKDA